MMDFNGAPDQEDRSELIPDKTIARMVMSIRPGGVGPSGILTQSKSSDAQMLDVEFTVSSGRYARRKIWENMVVTGGKTDDNGNSIAGNITRAKLRAILESARGIDPNDASDRAIKARKVSGFNDFDGMEFVGKVGIDKAKPNTGFSDKNKIALVITPDRSEYGVIMKGGQLDGTPAPKSTQAGWGTPGQADTGTPAWAQGGKPAASQPAAEGATPAWVHEDTPQQNNIPAWAQ